MTAPQKIGSYLHPQTYPKTYTMTPKLVLASGSATRQAMLRQSGLAFEVIPARIDEASILAALLADDAKPHDIADALAEYKARRVSQKLDQALVLGSDQILDLKGRVFTKPTSREDAKQTLLDLQGQTHRLLSAAVIYEDGEPVWRSIGQARMTMHPMTPAEVDMYLDQTWPDVASSVGAYHAEGYGARLFSRIDGDWYSVLGMPLLNVLSFFRLRGWLHP